LTGPWGRGAEGGKKKKKKKKKTPRKNSKKKEKEEEEEKKASMERSWHRILRLTQSFVALGRVLVGSDPLRTWLRHAGHYTGGQLFPLARQ
jgi:hypothetical protein